MRAPQQLPLSFDWSRLPRLAAAGVGLETTGLDAIAALTQTLAGCVLIWGGEGVGKTHLLRAAGAVVAEQGGSAQFYTAADGEALLPLSESVSSALPDFIAIDAIDALVGDPKLEAALFRLVFQAREGEIALLLASRRHPEVCGIQLADLRTRLNASDCYRLHEPDDANKQTIVMAYAEGRGMQLTPEVLNFLFTHLPRDLHSLCRFVDRLDQASLARRVTITTRLARELLALEFEAHSASPVVMAEDTTPPGVSLHES